MLMYIFIIHSTWLMEVFSQDNLQVIKVGIPSRQLLLEDLGSSQFRVKTMLGQTVEDQY